MRLIALLSFYDEPVTDLVSCITTAAEAGVSEIVAVDGAYALYPSGAPASPANQHAAIVLACRNLNLGLTLHVPRETWAGGEVEKRSLHFKLAHAMSMPGDWFWIMDADEIVRKAPGDLKVRLERSKHDCADIEVLDTVALRANLKNLPPRFTARRLFRAQPITVRTNHVTYVAGDGRLLWGYEDSETPVAPGLDLASEVLIEHRPDRRPQERLLAKYQYYAQRDAARIERGNCALCGESASELVPTRWRMTEIGPAADWMEACEPCAEKADLVNRVTLQGLGIDPDSVTVENRMGRPPVQRDEHFEPEALTPPIG